MLKRVITMEQHLFRGFGAMPSTMKTLTLSKHCNTSRCFSVQFSTFKS